MRIKNGLIDIINETIKMNKIGILTQPLRGNYGGNVQNWALQQVLIRLGHNPITINIAALSKSSIINYLRNLKDLFFATFVRYIKRDWIRYVNNPFIVDYQSYEPARLDSRFRKQINKTYGVGIFDDLMKEININSFDAFIVGSDQVWRQDFSLNIETYFLDF